MLRRFLARLLLGLLGLVVLQPRLASAIGLQIFPTVLTQQSHDSSAGLQISSDLQAPGQVSGIVGDNSQVQTVAYRGYYRRPYYGYRAYPYAVRPYVAARPYVYAYPGYYNTYPQYWGGYYRGPGIYGPAYRGRPYYW